MISRSALKEFARSLGFDPADVKRIEITPHLVTVTTYQKRDENGHRYAVGDGVATVTTEIRVQRDEEAST